MSHQKAFDEIAPTYDQSFSNTWIGSVQRAQVNALIERITPTPLRILEINCGTGEDAISLARQGHKVVATDISEVMIDQAKAKLSLHGPDLAVTFLPCNFLALDKNFNAGAFDLIFSNFGGLNCIDADTTQELANTFARLLAPGGQLILVYISKYCWWEKWYYFLTKDRKNSNRRIQKGPVYAQLGATKIPIWYYSIEQLQDIFQPHFRKIAQKPIGLFIPPSYVEGQVKKRPRLFKFLERLDQIARIPSLANYADHFALILKKVS